MDADMTLHGDRELAQMLESLGRQASTRARSAMNEIAGQWQREAKRRCPVRFGILRDRILKEVGTEHGDVYAAVGTNVYYGKYLEFGTARIADGRVKQLGTDPHVTDEMAIKDWKAKEMDAAGREQMPWLRPAFWAIRDWAVGVLARALGRVS